MVPLSTSLDPEQAASSEELATLLTEAVDALPHELRVVVVMRLIEGLDTTEAADCLDLSESNVKVRLHRARALLREQIDARVGIEARRLYLFGGDRCDRVVRAVMARLQSD